ncbi:MAG: hypothetical protein QOH41_732 [Blastocatellia bacterium]|jgi:hypothetical protein|nr:hypothetical protein [Blastocatellia bacterium]
MKKLKKIVSGLCLAAVLAFSILPTTVVHADDSGPQGTSNSKTTKPPPPPPPSSVDLMWLLIALFTWLFG